MKSVYSGVLALYCALLAWGLLSVPLPSVYAQSDTAKLPQTPTQESLEFLGTPVPGGQLKHERGAGLGHMIDPSVLGQNGALLSSVPTIGNGIAGNAFSGSKGIFNVIQNTGNNVNISSSINMNLRFIK